MRTLLRLSVVAAAAVLPAYPRVGAFVLPVSSSARGFSQESVGSSSNSRWAASNPSPASASATSVEEAKSNLKRVLVENNGSTLSKDVLAAVEVRERLNSRGPAVVRYPFSAGPLN